MKYSTNSHDSAPVALFHSDGRLTISAPFVPSLPYRIKRVIPVSGRSYSARTRRWQFEAEWAAVAIEIVRDLWPDATIIAARRVA